MSKCIMWSYINKISSLEEKALAQVANNLCQENGFKEVAMHLEKPTYGCFISGHGPSFFVSDPEKSSRLQMRARNNRLSSDSMICYYLNDIEEKVRQWDTAVDEQCQRLTEGIPNQLRQKIHPWINRIALEYLSYSRRQEVLFGVSRYFLMNIFARGDWKEAARLDEQKLAQRLLEDERLTVLQRYRIACVYCLHVHIPQLWERLTHEEKRFTSGDGKRGLSGETHSLVLSWSSYMNAYQNKKVASKKYFLWTAVSHALSYGNHAALMVCWKEYNDEHITTVIDSAMECLRHWKSMENEFHVKKSLVSYQCPGVQFDYSMKHFNLPSYYSELMFFLLSQMDEEQQLIFFKKAFQSGYPKSVLECFLDWPQQVCFLSTINRLWGIIPKDQYGQCLLALARKYSGNDKAANRDYDYRSLLRALWEETPEDYKQYVLCKAYLGTKLLSQLSQRSPFQEKDEALFKLIFRDQPQEKRKAMMLSTEGEEMCLGLMQKEKWSFLNGLLEECLSKEEIPDFKDKLIENNDCLDVCESLLFDGKLADVQRKISFCLSSDEKKERLKVRLAQRACVSLYYKHGCILYYKNGSWLKEIEDCIWEQMDTIIAWSVDTEEKVRDLKKDLFSRKGIDIHYGLLILEVLRGRIKRFYQWFGLSPEEIKQLKRDTLFTPRFIKYIYESLPDYRNTLVAPLRLCLTDEEMVIDLKKEVEKEYFTEVLDESGEMKKVQFDHLVSELLDGFRNVKVLDKTG